MSSIIKSSSRYNSSGTRSSTQSHQSDPSSSAELRSNSGQSSLKRAIVRANAASDLAPPSRARRNDQNLGAMVKRLMGRRPSSKNPKGGDVPGLVVPVDLIAEDLRKTARKGANFDGLHRKLFGKGSKERGGGDGKALTEAKANTRTLGMVLRSERELLSQNKEQEAEIAELKLILEDKNREVEKLKDLCLKQKEEIKALKSAVLFPDDTNLQFQDLLEKQGSELNQAKQLIPSLQRQVTSLTGQLQCLADDLEEVKADKYSVRSCYDAVNCPKTPTHDQEEASNSLEFSSGDYTTSRSPDYMFVKDLNPCLTPYYAKTKSKEFEALGYDSPHDERLNQENTHSCREIGTDFHIRKLSKSSDCRRGSSSGNASARVARRSDESKSTNRKPIHQRFL